MNISRYIFQSPYPNQVQIGRPDPSASKDLSSHQQSTEILENPDTIEDKSAALSQTDQKDVKPEVSSTNLLDTYA